MELFARQLLAIHNIISEFYMRINKNISKLTILAYFLSLPLSSFADFDVGSVGQPNPSATITPTGLFNSILNGIAWPFIVVTVIVLFILGGFKFITAQGEPTKIKEARLFLLWGLIGIIVILISFSAVITIKSILGIN